MVVDDGSTDGTTEWLEELATNASFPITVIRQDNGGKHRALNRAAREIQSPWLLVVDSDDWLLPCALRNMLCQARAADAEVMAIIAPRETKTHKFRAYERPGQVVDYSKWQALSDGDTSILMRRAVLLGTGFPEHVSEMFIAESALYAKAFASGGILLSNERLIGAEYQAEGLSARSHELRLQNPLGCLSTYGAQMASLKGGKNWVRACLNYHRFYWHAYLQGKNPVTEGFKPSLLWVFIAMPVYLADLLRARIWLT